MPEKPWLAAKNVEWLKVGERKLGGDSCGDVYSGKLKFRGKKAFAVAVKRFHDNLRWMAPGAGGVERYPRVIENLRKAGVPMPKMAFMQHEGKPVVVSELFAKGGRSKIMEIRDVMDQKPVLNEKEVERIKDTMVRVFNAGHVPTFDCMSLVRTKKGLVPLVHDVDLFAQPPFAQTMFTVKFLSWLYPENPANRVKAFEDIKRRVTHPASQEALKMVKKMIET
ncbi:MAG: hypothetical protein NTY90_00740 [Candidatus Micrarchaeota archaeon]|nr:hypothetical protein [Candidatus Micrarchaeota archaeon]